MKEERGKMEINMREKRSIYVIQRELLKSSTKKMDSPIGMGRQLRVAIVLANEYNL